MDAASYASPWRPAGAPWALRPQKESWQSQSRPPATHLFTITSQRVRRRRQRAELISLSPESKFLGAEHLDRGPTRRRHVQAISIDHIGKEANRWEEQFYLGLNLDMQIEYGTEQINSAEIRDSMLGSKFSSRQLADMTGISRNDISAFRKGKIDLSQNQMRRLLAAIRSRNSSQGNQRNCHRTI